jgi:membrane associated rhomboid family serine protease
MTHPENSEIPAKTKRLALDWSLVLVSQGIEAIIHQNEKDGSFRLIVPEQDYPRAITALKLYQKENRHGGWRQEYGPITFDWAALAWCFLTTAIYFLDAQWNFRSTAWMDSSAVLHGQWWRLFTSVWLHADVGHLAANLAMGVVFLGLVMGGYGTAIGLTASYLAGIVGNVIALVLLPKPHLSLGASGLVMGALGLLTVQSWQWLSTQPWRARRLIVAVLGGTMLFILFGLTPGTDVTVHLGGFVSGLALGLLIKTAPPRVLKQRDALIYLVFSVAVVIPWLFAFLKARQ